MALYEKQEDNERQCERNEADNRQESFVKNYGILPLLLDY